MKLKLLGALAVSLAHFALSAQNVLISNVGSPNEPSIMFDPNNPDHVVAGSNLNFYYTSNDGGATWESNTLTSQYGVWGDPTIDVDTAGNFYFFHLSNPTTGNWIDRIVCQKSTDNGITWNAGSYTGLNGNKAQDKQWSAIDRVNNIIYLTWTQFDAYGSANPSDSSIILFSKSSDNGVSWTQAKRINKHAGDCIDEDLTVEGAVPAVGPNGEVYVSWAGPNGVVFNRSMDQGETWLDEEILIDPMPTGWDYMIPGINRCNGLPITKCDLSGGPNHRTIYVNWSDQRNGEDDTDVWLSKSTDGGDTWIGPMRVNTDSAGNQQFLTWMDIDQTNGNLYFIFYDRRNYSDNQTDVCLAASTNGGNSFLNKIISESPFLPNPGVFFGDYNNIVAHDGIIRPIWTRSNLGELSIWTDLTPADYILNTPDEPAKPKSHSVANYPNPASNMSYVSFKLHELSNVQLKMIDQQGRAVHTIIENDEMDYGKYVIPVNLEELQLPAGNYFYTITINDDTQTLRTIVVD